LALAVERVFQQPARAFQWRDWRHRTKSRRRTADYWANARGGCGPVKIPSCLRSSSIRLRAARRCNRSNASITGCHAGTQTDTSPTA